ncbi:MAG: hypothetical protein K0B09_14240 [Bacteroidales bacterium]|nr:hypothetical protein [Bacteroidales bacterium]
MKKLIFATALIIFASSFAHATAPKRVLTFKDTFGRILTMPAIDEAAQEEAFPFDQPAVFKQAKLETINHIFDISAMSKPEAEVDDIPGELRNIIVR